MAVLTWGYKWHAQVTRDVIPRRVNMKTNFDASEGERRLRLLGSSLVAIATYVFSYVEEYRVSTEEMFLQFPLLSVLGFVLAYILFSAVYWVIDGFKPESKISNGISLISSEAMFRITDATSTNLHAHLTEFVGIDKPNKSENSRTMEIVNNGWRQSTLSYVYGLTCLCLIKRDRAFMQSVKSFELFDSISTKLAELILEEDQKYFSNSLTREQAQETGTEEAKSVIQMTLKSVSSVALKNTNDPLQLLNEHFANKIGLTDASSFARLRSRGKSTLIALDKLIEEVAPEI